MRLPLYVNSASAPRIRWNHANGSALSARPSRRPLPVHRRLARVGALVGVVPIIVGFETGALRVVSFFLYGAPWFYSNLSIVDNALIIIHAAASLTFGVLGILFSLGARSAARAAGIEPRGTGAVGITLGILHSLNLASGVVMTFLEW